VNSDTFFAGCRAHPVCEDYARSGAIAGRSYTIVSDGCSSSPDTDIGARLLTLEAARAIARPEHYFPEGLIAGASALISPPLVPECLDATLLIAQETPAGVEVRIAGDGFIIARIRPDSGFECDTRLIIYEFDFKGAPGYLSYLLNLKRRETYLQEGYGRRAIRTWSLFRDQPPSLFGLHHDNPFTKEADYPNYPDDSGQPFFTREFQKSKCDLVVICTDGAGAFQHKDTLEPVPFHEVIRRLVAFPSFTGEFVTRRVRKFLTKECIELGWVQNDDLAVGAIYMSGV